MEVSYKNGRQQEFCELMKRMELLKFKPADVARLIKKTPGAISQYLSGTTNPSDTVLEIFRRVVEEKEGRKAEPEVTDIQLREQLADLARFSPPDYEVAKLTILTLHGKLPAVVNSKPPSSATKLLDVAAETAPGPAPKRRRKP